MYLCFTPNMTKVCHYKNRCIPLEVSPAANCVASPLLAAFRKRVKRYLHVKCVAAQDSIPLYRLGNGGTTLEVEDPRATIPCWFLRYSQLSILETQTLVSYHMS